MAKAVKKVQRNPNSTLSIPSLLGLALLLGLLCLLPWVSGLEGGELVRTAQLSLALLLALAGGFCLGLQVAHRRK